MVANIDTTLVSLALWLALASCGNQAANDTSNGASGTVGPAGLGGGSSAGSAGALGSSAGAAGSSGASSGSAGESDAQGGSAGSNAGSGGNGTAGASGGTGAADHWVGTWATAPQLTEAANLPPSPGLQGNTLRQIVHVSIGGSQLRLRISNEFGNAAVTMDAVHVAASAGGGAIDSTKDRLLMFSGAGSVTIPVGKAVFSDPFSYALAPLSDLAISIHFSSTPRDVTGHPGSRATSYLESGNVVANASLATPGKAEHWYFISGLDVMAGATSEALVVLGDSITDGRGSTTNGNTRWSDALARRLQANAATAAVGVLNEGIGGNTVLRGGLGPTATNRFSRDVLGQSAARWLIILEGVNDLDASASSNDLITAYQSFIQQAHQQGMRAYGMPILPFGGSGYDSPAHESARKAVNDWIRTSGKFDKVIDSEMVVRDPARPSQLLATYDSGDHLHPNVAGYQKMADAIDLSLFAQ